MKYIFALLLTCFVTTGATITGNIRDVTDGTFNPRVEFWPVSTPYSSGSTNVIGQAKVVQPINGVFSQQLLAGRYLVKFPPTTNSFYIHVPNDANTYTLASAATNVSTVTGIATAPVWGVTGALTNNDTRQVGLSDRLTIGSAATDGRIILTDGDTKSYTATVGSDGWYFSQPVEASSFLGSGANLTSLNGANIQTGTISTNKMDATAYAAFVGRLNRWNTNDYPANYINNNILIGSNLPAASALSNSVVIANDMVGLIYGEGAIFISPGSASGGAGQHSIGIGNGAGAQSYSIAIGDQCDAFGTYGISIGANSGGNDGDWDILIGGTIVSQSRTNLILIGNDQSASEDNVTIIGHTGSRPTQKTYLAGRTFADGTGITNAFVSLVRTNFQATTVSPAGVTLTNFVASLSLSNAFNYNLTTGRVTNTYAGIYRVNVLVNAGANAATSDVYRLSLWVNGVNVTVMPATDGVTFISTDIGSVVTQQQLALNEIINISASSTIEVKLHGVEPPDVGRITFNMQKL